MPSTYSPNLRIELIASGEQANTWGNTTNTNLGTLIEQAIAGLSSIDVTAGDVTLTAYNGASDQSRQMILNVTGTPGVARTLTAPSVSKVYVVANNSTADVTIETATGVGVTISSGYSKFVFCDGTDFSDVTTEASVLAVEDLIVNGDATLGDALTDVITINGTIQPGVVISGSSASTALRITQTGAGNALVVEDSANPDSTPFVVNTNGQVAIGLAGASIPGGVSLYVASDGTANYEMDLVRSSDNSGGQSFEFRKTRGTIASPTVVVSGDTCGNIVFRGYDGSGNIQAATIVAAVDGTPGTNDMPGRLVFSTTADGASSPTERMRINAAGSVGIGTNPTNVPEVKLILGGTWPSSGGYSTAYSASGTVPSTTTTEYASFNSAVYTQSTAFTLGNIRHFTAQQPSAFSGGSVVTNQYGFIANSNLTGATNNYGFYSNIASGTGRYNFYAAGTAENYFAGLILSNSSIKSNSATAGVGYGTGAGGTVTQTISRTTGVTLNKICGSVTLFSASATVAANFTVTNSTVSATDTILCSIQASGATELYQATTYAVANGSFKIYMASPGTATEAPTINFTVLKSVTA